MIRISVMYPNENGKRFDWDYYTNKHIPAAKQLTPLGLIRIEVEKGIGSAQPGAMAPYVAMAHLYFNTMEDMLRCQSQSGDSMADIHNFTDIQPQIQIGEIL